MKKSILKIFIMIVTIISVISTFSFAGAYIPGASPSIGNSNVQTMAVNIISSLKWIGYVIAIGMLIYIGIKYVIASADERASMKGMLVKVVIGSLIIITSVTIVDAVLSIAGPA